VTESATVRFGHSVNVYFRADLASLRAERPFALTWTVGPEAQGTFAVVGAGLQEWTFNFEAERDQQYSETELIAAVRRGVGDPDLAVDILDVLRWDYEQAVTDTWRVGRTFFCGDSAHRFPPHGGFGMNSGVQDAENLAWKLAAVLDGRAAPILLDSYEAERIPFARSLVRTTDRVFEAFVGRGVFSRTVRSVFLPFVLPLALRFSAARRAQFRLVSQVRIAYRESPLSDGSAGGVHAGDRLPWVEGADNFAPLRSLDWQVHVHGTATPALREFATGAAPPLREWPWTPAARDAGLSRDALYLVRPDGHVGFARRAQDIEGLRAYLDRFGIADRAKRAAGVADHA
jgi:hypothetical protein